MRVEALDWSGVLIGFVWKCSISKDFRNLIIELYIFKTKSLCDFAPYFFTITYYLLLQIDKFDFRE